MKRNVGRIVRLLVNAQEGLSQLTPEERMLVGEKVSSAFRQRRVLLDFKLTHREFVRRCEMETAHLLLRINGEDDSSDEIPF